MSNDEELRISLTQLGVDVGPINQSTRELYKRMLKKRRNELPASNLGSAPKRLKPAPSPPVSQRAKARPATNSQRNGKTKKMHQKSSSANKAVALAASPASKKKPSNSLPRTPESELKRHNRLPVARSPSIYPRLPSLPSSTPNLPSRKRLSFPPSPYQRNSNSISDDDIAVPSSSPVSPPPYPKRGSSYNNPPPTTSPPSSPNRSTNSTDGSSGVVSTITNWLGARVKNIIGRIQEVASPSPRRPLSRIPSAGTPSSPSAPISRPPAHDSISINKLDFSQDGGAGSSGAVYLHVPSPPKEHPRGGVAAFPHHSPHSRGPASVGSRYDWELLPGDVEICKKASGELWLLGKGGCGQVYRGLKDRVDDVAIKVIRLQGYDPLSAVEQFKQEIDMISKLRHRHIVQFYGACIQPSCLFMVTELMDTDLFSALRRGSEYKLDGTHGREVLVGIASGLHHLHSRRPPIVHRDIKSPNILVVSGLAKIADVGIANTMAATDMTAQRGFTVAWAAPEVILRRRANEKIDIWSFGIILWEVITGRIPRPGQLVFPAQAPSHLRNLYTRCTSDDPSGRPAAADIVHTLKER